MTNETATPIPDSEEAESSLQSAVWLAGDLGIAMPPIPGLYADLIEEASLGDLFTTDRGLLALNAPASIAAAAAENWPRCGLAFGFVARGSGGRWFYTLASERIILHISLGMRGYPEGSAAASAAQISAAHAQLEGYLSDDAHYQVAISVDPPPGGSPRRVVYFSDQNGIAAEWHASLAAGEGALSPFEEREELFVANRGSVPDMREMSVLWV